MFEIGDRVYCVNNKHWMNPKIVGQYGTVVAVTGDGVGAWYGVTFDCHVNGHDLGGRCAHGYGFWLYAENLDFVERDTTELLAYSDDELMDLFA